MMRNKIKRFELIIAARTYGWRGTSAGKTLDYFWTYLDGKGITEQQVKDAVARVRNPNAAQSQQPATSGGVTIDDVRRIVHEEAVSILDQHSTDEALLRQIVEAAVAKASPEKIVVNTLTKEQVKVTGAHPMFQKVLKLVASGVNVLIVGPAGCGKTTLAHMVAKAMKRKFGMLSCTSGASESQLTGWLLPVGAGKKAGEFTYVPSEFVKMYEEGNGIFLFDEFDAADPNMLLVINSALANGSLHVPQRHEEPLVKRGKNFGMIAAANTYGSGADMLYAGRNQLDAATLDRFYVVEMDYDVALEKSLAPEEAVKWVWEIRSKVKASRLRRVISTRAVQKLGAALSAGIDFAEAKRDLLTGWTTDELMKVGIAQ